MEQLLNQIQIKVNEKIYHKDPLSSELGKKIISESCAMMATMGFEDFTFKKLATQINTTEASIYRYFENKHRILIYLISVYWAWKEYLLVFATANIDDPVKRLERALDSILSEEESQLLLGIEVKHLNVILMAESAKAYLVKEVEAVNKDGFYQGY